MSSKPRRAEGFELEQMAEGYMVHDAAAGRVHYLNHTAAIVFELCDGATTEQDIAEAVRDLYDMSEAPHAEVAACLASLREEKLVT